jgi:exodeoxyribonuclease III
MKSITYNVNGIRSALSKSLLNWLKAADADIVCLQEVKAEHTQIDLEVFAAIGYEHIYWFSAEKKGYSGVAILSKQKPKQVIYGCQEAIYDHEGRVIRADFEDFSQMCVYMPSGSSGEHRQSFKMKWLDFFLSFSSSLSKEIPNLIISGDFNICHKPIDIHNPKSNANSSGFLPEERAWMDVFTNQGWIDAFREFCSEPHHYTWWSFRAGARNKNLGWRIDYHMVNPALKERLNKCRILPEARHSDHCPVVLEFSSVMDKP